MFQGAKAETLRFRSKLILFPLTVLSHPPAMVTSSQTEATLEQKGPEWAFSVGQGMRGLSQDTSHSLRLLCICHLCKHQFAWSCLDAVPSLSQLCPPTCILSLIRAAFFLAQSCSRAPGARAGAVVGWEACWSGHQQKSQLFQSASSSLFLRVSKYVCTICE